MSHDRKWQTHSKRLSQRKDQAIRFIDVMLTDSLPGCFMNPGLV